MWEWGWLGLKDRAWFRAVDAGAAACPCHLRAGRDTCAACVTVLVSGILAQAACCVRRCPLFGFPGGTLHVVLHTWDGGVGSQWSSPPTRPQQVTPQIPVSVVFYEVDEGVQATGGEE